MIGEFGEGMREAPYLLESLYDTHKTTPLDVAVKVEVLVALLKLFFRRAPEVDRILRRVMGEMLSDVSDADAHDRAMFYYRLLRKDVHQCANVVLGPSSGGGGGASASSRVDFAEDKALLELKERLYDEFNTLSVLYGRTHEFFVDKEYQMRVPSFREAVLALRERQQLEQVQASVAVAAAAGSPRGWRLNTSYDGSMMDQAGFQRAWTSMGVKSSTSGSLASAPELVVDSGAGLEQKLDGFGVRCMASGDLGTALKLYLHCMDSDGMLYLAELVVDKASMQTRVTVKSEAGEEASGRVAHVLASASAPSAGTGASTASNGGGGGGGGDLLLQF